MKKILTASALLLTISSVLAGCGDRSDDGSSYYDRHDYGYGSSDSSRPSGSASDRAKDAVDGAGDAAKDIIDGAENAADDVIDGVAGERTSRSSAVTRTSVRTTTIG